MPSPPPTVEHDHSREAIRRRLASAGAGSWVRDGTYGALDGAITTLAIVAGATAAGLSHRAVLALGVANVLADGFSMAASNWSGVAAEREQVDRLRAMERRHVLLDPAGERRELEVILERKGFDPGRIGPAVEALSAHRELWVDLMLVEEHGVSPLPASPWRAGVITFIAFVLAGLLPLVPYLFGAPYAWPIALALALVVFALTGALGAEGRGARLRAALRTLAIGVGAGTIAWYASTAVTVGL